MIELDIEKLARESGKTTLEIGQMIARILQAKAEALRIPQHLQIGVKAKLGGK